ncbi:hypothetical protein COLO4_02217 [Corchorus olitorius]|uniref:RNase H type-1 domain-containing protein n=1 Tax=Corchorus olitorius TaxID=93759 RepID=A0A1R3L1B8_9ROSI|nr:hypothetical protein COLO4_02217 [Corchorus olitorius]
MNVDMLTTNFNASDAAAILEIPLSRKASCDRLVWHFCKHGIYSVKSGYRTLVDSPSMESNDGGADSLEGDSLIFKDICMATIPNKIKVFAWKLYHNILTVKANLLRKNIGDDDKCPSHLQSSGCDSWFTLSLVTEWAIWKDRNLELHEGKKARPPTTVHLIVALTQEYGQAQTIHGPTVVLSDLPCGPPPEGTVKLNFDPSFCEKDHRGGIGVVARDHRGLPLGCLAERIAGLYNPFVAEMIAALGEIWWAYDMAFSDIILEGDALCIIKKLKTANDDLYEIGNLLT